MNKTWDGAQGNNELSVNIALINYTDIAIFSLLWQYIAFGSQLVDKKKHFKVPTRKYYSGTNRHL